MLPRYFFGIVYALYKLPYLAVSGGAVPYTSVFKEEILGPRVLWQRARENGRLLGRRVESGCIRPVLQLCHQALKTIVIKSYIILPPLTTQGARRSGGKDHKQGEDHQ